MDPRPLSKQRLAALNGILQRSEVMNNPKTLATRFTICQLLAAERYWRDLATGFTEILTDIDSFKSAGVNMKWHARLNEIQEFTENSE